MNIMRLLRLLRVVKQLKRLKAVQPLACRRKCRGAGQGYSVSYCTPVEEVLQDFIRTVFWSSFCLLCRRFNVHLKEQHKACLSEAFSETQIGLKPLGMQTAAYQGSRGADRGAVQDSGTEESPCFSNSSVSRTEFPDRVHALNLKVPIHGSRTMLKVQEMILKLGSEIRLSHSRFLVSPIESLLDRSQVQSRGIYPSKLAGEVTTALHKATILILFVRPFYGLPCSCT